MKKLLGRFFFGFMAISFLTANAFAVTDWHNLPWSSATPNNFVYVPGIQDPGLYLLSLSLSNNPNSDGINVIPEHGTSIFSCLPYPVINGKIHIPAGTSDESCRVGVSTPYFDDIKFSADGSTGHGASGTLSDQKVKK